MVIVAYLFQYPILYRIRVIPILFLFLELVSCAKTTSIPLENLTKRGLNLEIE